MKIFNSLLIIFISLFFFCNKKFFKRIEVKGIVMDFFTNAPMKCEVILMGKDRHDDPNILLKSTTTKKDGVFDFKCPSVNSKHYILNIQPLNKKTFSYGGRENVSIWLDLNDKASKNLGLIFDMRHRFILKATIQKKSGIAYDFVTLISEVSDTTKYLNSPNSNIKIIPFSCNKAEFIANDSLVKFEYQLLNSNNSVRLISKFPINRNSDTVFATIDY